MMMQQQNPMMMNMGLGPQMSMPNNGMGMMQAPPQQFAPVAVSPSVEANPPPVNITKGGFKVTNSVKEFIPAGKVVKTQEQFPDLDCLDDKP